MKLEDGKWYLNDVARRMVQNQPELIRRVGVTVLGVAVRATPPNRGGMAKGYDTKAGRNALQLRIATEVLGAGSGSRLTVPTAIPTASGGVVPGSWEGPKRSFGGYRFVVPREAGRVRLRYADPEAILAQRRFYRKGNVVRARGPQLKGWQPRWVKASALKKAVVKLQARAGALASGLLPAARSLHASGLAAFNLSKQPRRGWARLTHQAGFTELDMGSDWSNLIVASRYLSQLSSYINSAAKKGIRNTENWYLKKIFG